MTAAIARPQPHNDWLARIRTVGLGLGGRGVMGLGLGRSSVQAAAGPVVLFSDTFTDADGANLASHTPNIGTGWTLLNGSTWQIQSNAAKPTNSGVANLFSAAAANATVSDGVVTCDVKTLTTGSVAGSGVLVRYSDASNFWSVVYERAGGTPTLGINKIAAGVATYGVASVAVPSDGNWHTIVVTLAGNSISATMDGTYTTSLSDAHNATATVHGLIGRDANYGPFDNFLIQG